MFTGLNAFPLTPLDQQRLDEPAFAQLVHRLAAAGVDGITALGSTGSYPYLSRAERSRVAQLAVQNAGDIPVMVGIGALRTEDVLRLAEDAQTVGAAGVLLAPVSYQALTADEVYHLFQTVAAAVSVPLAVYDNPGTTHFTFTDELYQAITALPQVSALKIPGVPAGQDDAAARIAQLRTIIPADVSIGVSGDTLAATGLNAGCDAWHSVIAGTLPEPALAITRAAQAGQPERAQALSFRLQPLWDLFADYGSLRVTAAIAEQLELVQPGCLPLPLLGLAETARRTLAAVIDDLELATELGSDLH